MSTIHVLLKRRAFEVFMSTMHGRVLAAMIGESRYSVFLCLLYLCASLSVLWLRCLRHGLRGGVSCAAFAAWADGDGRRSFTSTIRLVLPYSSADCAASVRRPGNTKYEGSTIGVCNAVVDLRAVMRWWFVGSRVLIRSVIVSCAHALWVGADAHMNSW